MEAIKENRNRLTASAFCSRQGMIRWAMKDEVLHRDSYTQCLPIRTASMPPTDGPRRAELFISSASGIQGAVRSTEQVKSATAITYLRFIGHIATACCLAICVRADWL
jgi:hypothetical protein